MLESWSDHARRAMRFAAAEARSIGQSQVGTEHLLLAMLVDDDRGVGVLLRGAGATLTAARHKVAELQRAELGSSAVGTLPYTPRAQRALDRAARFSRQDLAANITTRHVLLGVLDIEGLACQVLRGLGVDVVQLRKAVIAAEAGTAAETGTDAEPVDEVDGRDRATIVRAVRCAAPRHGRGDHRDRPVRRRGRDDRRGRLLRSMRRDVGVLPPRRPGAPRGA